MNSSTPMQATVPTPQTPAGVSNQDAQFAQAAASSDAFEIQSSQLALQRTRSPAVRRFAQRMIDDHSKSTQQLTDLATAKGITVAPSLDPNQEHMLAVLQGAQRSFDTEYWRDQVTGHQAAVATFQSEISNGYDPDFKSFAQQTLPIIQDHLSMAQRRGR